MSKESRFNRATFNACAMLAFLIIALTLACYGLVFWNSYQAHDLTPSQAEMLIWVDAGWNMEGADELRDGLTEAFTLWFLAVCAVIAAVVFGMEAKRGFESYWKIYH